LCQSDQYLLFRRLWDRVASRFWPIPSDGMFHILSETRYFRLILVRILSTMIVDDCGRVAGATSAPSSPCKSHPCQNGGRCVVEAIRGIYECKCALGFLGVDCEYRKSLSSFIVDSRLPGDLKALLNSLSTSLRRNSEIIFSIGAHSIQHGRHVPPSLQMAGHAVF